MSNGHVPSRDEPAPQEILRALQRAFADKPRLKIALKMPRPEEAVGQFFAGGYMSEEPSAKLEAAVLEMVRIGGFGLHGSYVLPCLLESLWDDDAGKLDSRIAVGLFIEWEQAPVPWENRTVPEALVHTKPVPCTDLIFDAEGVLRNKMRWPVHLCDMEFMQQSTQVWAQARQFASDSLNIFRWANMHPLPIGRRALAAEREVVDLSEWSGILDALPFEGDETALWALHVEPETTSAVRNSVDLFGLAHYPTEYHKDVLRLPVGGDLAFVLRGGDTSTIDLVRTAQQWWSRFRGQALLGRPRGSGTWANKDEFAAAVHGAVTTLRTQGEKVTQERVAGILRCDDRLLRSWIERFGLNWPSLSETP